MKESISSTNSHYKFKYLLPLITVLTCFFTLSSTSIAQDKLSVLITGANRGIGLEYAKQYSHKGYAVYGTARNPDKATELKATGATIIKLDVTSDADIAAMAKTMQGKKLDILINNAGVLNRTEKSRDVMLQGFSVNTLGPMYVAEALLPNLKASKNPKIINISSRLSVLKNGSGKPVPYAVSKAGLNMVTRIQHTDLKASGFIVISMDPGWNKTDMGGKSAPLTPQQTVPKMIEVIDSLKAEDSGKFYNYEKNEHPW